MGYLTGRETYGQIVAKMQAAIDQDLDAGHELTRLGEIGEAILHEHVPASKVVGDPCPKCADEKFPCTIMRSFIIDPD